MPLLSASAGSTPRYLDGGGGLLSRQVPFSYGTAPTDEVEERVASSSSSSGGYSSESESESSSSDDDDDDDEDGKENRQHSAKLLLEQFLMSEKKEKKRPTEMGYKQNGTNGIASTRARETTTSKSIQFKPLLKTPPRLKKVAHHHQEQPPQQKSQTTQTERELRKQNTSSPYTPLTTHAAARRWSSVASSDAVGIDASSTSFELLLSPSCASVAHQAASATGCASSEARPPLCKRKARRGSPLSTEAARFRAL